MRRIGSIICVSILFVCCVLMISSCRDNKLVIDNANESIQQIYENDSNSNWSELESKEATQSTSIQETDTSTITPTDTTSEGTIQDTEKIYTEMLEDGIIKYTFQLVGTSEMFSISVPSDWKLKINTFSETFVDTYVTADKKRMGVSKLSDTTVEQWEESQVDGKGPICGETTCGYSYICYYNHPLIEKDVNWRIYHFIIIVNEDNLYSVTLHYNLDKDTKDYYETVVIPIINSIKIEQEVNHG